MISPGFAGLPCQVRASQNPGMRGSFRRGIGGGLTQPSSLGGAVGASEEVVGIGGSGLALNSSLGGGVGSSEDVFDCGIGGDGFMFNSSLAEVGDDPEEVLVGDIGGNGNAITSRLGLAVLALEDVIV